MISPGQVQFYNLELKRLEHPWHAKVLKWLEHECIQITSETEAVCMPLAGYNKSRYTLKRVGFGWTCDCQGWGKRGNCSHVEALKLKLTYENRDDKQGNLF